ncbi:putative ribonuclease H-like domain-containing protein [Tanacetum coccineum]
MVNAGTKAHIDEGQGGMKTFPGAQYVLLPFLTFDSQSPKSSEDEVADDAGKKNEVLDPAKEDAKSVVHYDDVDVGLYEGLLNNLETTMNVSPIPTTRIHKDHPKNQIIGDINSATQTRRMTKSAQEHAMVSYIKKQKRTNHKDYQNCLFSCFLSQIEPKKVTQALTDPSKIEAMQDELLQFRWQKVSRLVDLPKGKHAIGTKWVYRNKKDERGIVVRNKARLVAQVQVYVDDIIFGYTKKSLCIEFESLMHRKFQMSSMGQLTFFLGLQVMQRDDGIFISQDNLCATVRIVDNGEQEITATVDGKEFTITEASVRRHLQLADVDGKVEKLGLLYPMYLMRMSMRRLWDIEWKRANCTTAASLDAAQASGNITKTNPRTITNVPFLGELVRCLSKRMKKLEKTVKSNKARRRAKIVVLDDEEDLEDSSKQGRMIEEIDQDARITLVTPTHSQGRSTEDQFGSLSADKQRQERAGYEAAVRLQEQLDEEERQRITIIHEEAKSFNIEEWENIQATIEADEEIAQMIQAEEREKYYEAKKARLLAELINQRKRYFVQQRAEERRNKPLTQAQQRTCMFNYIKHMGSHTLQQLKRLSFDELKVLFETTMRRVQTFHPIESEGDKTVPELTTGSSKRDAEVELDHEGSKKKKTNEASGSVKDVTTRVLGQRLSLAKIVIFNYVNNYGS